MDDIMWVLCPIFIILFALLFMVGVAFLRGYFVTGEVDGIPAGINELVLGIVMTLIGGGVSIGCLGFGIIGTVCIMIEKREKKESRVRGG